VKKEAAKVLQPGYTEMVLYAVTRWIGAWYELTSILQYETVLNNLAKGEYQEELVYPDYFFAIVKDLVAVLNVLVTPIVQFQTSGVPLTGFQLLVLDGVNSSLEQVSAVTAVGSQFRKVLVESLRTRFAVLLYKDFDCPNYSSFRLSEFLDPAASRLRNVADFTSFEDHAVRLLYDFGSRFQVDMRGLFRVQSQPASDSTNPRKRAKHGEVAIPLLKIFASAAGKLPVTDQIDIDLPEDEIMTELKAQVEMYTKLAVLIKNDQTCLQW
jgi:hypothetical protein